MLTDIIPRNFISSNNTINYFKDENKLMPWITDLMRPMLINDINNKSNNFYIYSDDAVYSGTQMYFNLNDIIFNIEEWDSNINKNINRYEVGIFIPYISQNGLDRFLSRSDIDYFSILFFDNVFIKNVNIYFDHKIADSLSINTNLVHGRIGGNILSKNNICNENFYLPYIEPCLTNNDPQNTCIIPPYKKQFLNDYRAKNLRVYPYNE